MNGLGNLSETDREYSLAPNDDLIRFWRSKVKVTATPYLMNYLSSLDKIYRE